MSDRDAFWAAVWAAPFDDLPRLVFADWLDEHGEVEMANAMRDTAGWRAAFDSLRPEVASYNGTVNRGTDDADLLDTLRHDWLPKLLEGGDDWTTYIHYDGADDPKLCGDDLKQFYRWIETVTFAKLPVELSEGGESRFSCSC